MTVNEGDTFLFEYPEPYNHLFIVITKVENGTVACTMITSVKGNPNHDDPACIIHAGDHPFIKHDSFIAYKNTVIFEESMLIKNLENGIYPKKEPVTPALLAKIKAGAFNSKKIQPRFLKYYK